MVKEEEKAYRIEHERTRRRKGTREVTFWGRWWFEEHLKRTVYRLPHRKRTFAREQRKEILRMMEKKQIERMNMRRRAET